MANALLYSKCLLFADDTVLYLGNEDEATAYAQMQLDLDAVHAWCNRNFLQYPEIPLKLGDKNILKTDSYKYLGTVIDSKLNCLAQYNNIIKKKVCEENHLF